MTFLFNSDAAAGAVFGEAFARELPDVAFTMAWRKRRPGQGALSA